MLKYPVTDDFYTEDQFNQNLWRMLNELHDKYVGELAEPWLTKRENKFSRVLADFTNALDNSRKSVE